MLCRARGVWRRLGLWPFPGDLYCLAIRRIDNQCCGRGHNRQVQPCPRRRQAARQAMGMAAVSRWI